MAISGNVEASRGGFTFTSCCRVLPEVPPALLRDGDPASKRASELQNHRRVWTQIIRLWGNIPSIRAGEPQENRRRTHLHQDSSPISP